MEQKAPTRQDLANAEANIEVTRIAYVRAQQAYWDMGQQIADIEGPEYFFKVGERIYDISPTRGSGHYYCAGYEYCPRSEENYPEQRSFALRYIIYDGEGTPPPEAFKNPSMTKYGWVNRFVNQAGYEAHCAEQSAKFRAEMLARRAAKEAQNG